MKPHSEAEDRAEQLKKRKDVIKRILSKHSAESTYEECLTDFLVDCMYLSGLVSVEQSWCDAQDRFNAENPNA